VNNVGHGNHNLINGKIFYPQELVWDNFYNSLVVHTLTPPNGRSGLNPNRQDANGWNGIKWSTTALQNGVPTAAPLGTLGTVTTSPGTLNIPLNLHENAGRNGVLRFTYTLVMDTYPTEQVTLTNNAAIRVNNRESGYPYHDNFPVISGGPCTFNASTTVTFGSDLVSKGSSVTANRAHFEIILNPDGVNLVSGSTNEGNFNIPNTQNLLVEDRMGENLEFFYDTLKVYKPLTNPDGSPRRDPLGNIIWSSAGTPITRSATFNANSLYTYTRTPIAGYSTHENGIVLVLPNAVPLKLTYDARIKGNVGDSVNIANTVEIWGVAHLEVMSMENITSLESWGAGGIERLYLTKADAENRAVKLPDAEFALYIGWKDGWPGQLFGGTAPPVVPDGVNAPLEFTTEDGWTFYFLEYHKTQDGGLAEFESRWLTTNDDGMAFAMLELNAPPGYKPAVPIGNVNNPQLESVVFFAYDPHPDIAGQKVRSVLYDIEITNESLKTTDNITIPFTKLAAGPASLSRQFEFSILEVTTGLQPIYRPRGTSLIPTQYNQTIPVNLPIGASSGNFSFSIAESLSPGVYHYMITEDRTNPHWLPNEQIFIARVTVAPVMVGSVTTGLSVLTEYFIVDETTGTWNPDAPIGAIEFVNIPDIPPMGVLLPETGGTGIEGHLISGLALITAAALFTIIKTSRKRARPINSRNGVNYDQLE
jgi:hypothetical protein